MLKMNQMTCHVKGISCVYGSFDSLFSFLQGSQGLVLKQACSKTKKAGRQNTRTVYNYLRQDYVTYLNYFPVTKCMWAMPLFLQSSVALLNDIALQQKLSHSTYFARWPCVLLLLESNVLACSLHHQNAPSQQAADFNKKNVINTLKPPVEPQTAGRQSKQLAGQQRSN